MIPEISYTRNLITISALLLIFNINVFSQVSAQISFPFNIFDNAGGQKTLQFGLDQTATESIDVHLGESDLPPYPPAGAFDARLILPENNFSGTLSSYKDYRFSPGYPFSDTLEHRIRYQAVEGATAMYFGWSLPPEVSGLLQDLAGGVIVNLPISGTGVYELTNFMVISQMKLFIYYNNIVTGLDHPITNLTSYILEQNYPNPFNPGTIIKFSIPEETHVNLSVFNMLGEIVEELINGNLQPGDYDFEFKASLLPAGIYFYRITAGNFISTKKMILLK